jgi:hypothetical protein
VADLNDQSSEFFKDIRQGHVFSVAALAADRAQERFVVVSQTCDVVLPKRPTVSLAQVVELDGTKRAEAATGTNPRLVPLPVLGEKYFADLCFIESRLKDDLVGLVVGRLVAPGIDLDDEQVKRDFTLSVTRWFGRFPFPDVVVPWLRPLERVVREKYRKQSSLGELLRKVIVEIRIEEAGQWRQPPYTLEVHTIVRAEVLPTLDDNASPVTDDFLGTLREPDDDVRSPAWLADIYARTTEAQQRPHVLHALAESFADLCEPASQYAEDEAVMSAVTAVEWQLWSDDEFPLARVRKSEPLDLEYLSEPDERS